MSVTLIVEKEERQREDLRNAKMRQIEQERPLSVNHTCFISSRPKTTNGSSSNLQVQLLLVYDGASRRVNLRSNSGSKCIKLQFSGFIPKEWEGRVHSSLKKIQGRTQSSVCKSHVYMKSNGFLNAALSSLNMHT